MSDARKQFFDFHFDAQLLLQFAAQTRFKRFAGRPFPARKLPQSAKMIVCAALRDEQSAVLKDKTGRDFDQVLIFHYFFALFTRH